MERTPHAPDQPSFVDEDADTIVDVVDPWHSEKTAQLDFDQPALSGEAKLVAGYLTMEQHGMFAELSVEEQRQIAETLKR